MKEKGLSKKRVMTLAVSTMLIMVALFSFGYLISQPASAQQNWADSNFLYRKKITIDNTDVDAQLSNFPVMVKITNDGALFNDVQADGDDIVFYNYYDNSTQLKHELEYWSVAGSVVNAIFWVNVTTVYNSVDTYFWMYYGYGSATDSSDPTNVWDSNFMAVWHLNGSSYSDIWDSTGNGYDGTGQAGTPSYQVAGRFGGYAVDFEAGDDEYITTVQTAITGASSQITCEYWIKAETVTYSSPIESDHNWAFYITGAGKNILILQDSGSAYHNYWSSTATDITVGEWIYCAGKYDGSGASGGELRQNTTEGQTDDRYDGGWTDTGSDTFIGSFVTDGVDFDGVVDELRVSTVARSDAWLKASYYSTDNSLLTLGSKETQVEPSSVTLTLPNDAFTHQGLQGNTSLSNETGALHEWGEFNISYNGTGDGIEFIRFNITDIHANITSSNCSYQFSSDNSTWGGAGGNWKGGGDGGYTFWLNASTYTTGNGCYGANPFPIQTNMTLYFVERVTIPSGIGNETYSTTTGTSRTWDAGYYT